MGDFFVRVWDHLVARTEGPMHLRFYFQPVMSLFFATKAAIKDVKNNVAPYFARLIYAKGQRKSIVKEAWEDVGKVFITGGIVDVIYQLIVVYKLKVSERFYPLESIIVAFVLAIFPYVIFRGLIGRIARLFIKNK